MYKPDIMFHMFYKGNKMRLIKDLGMKPTPNGKHKRRYGLYECPTCKGEFEVKTTHVGKECYKCSRTNRTTHGMTNTAPYRSWANMLTRTTNKNGRDYEFYKDKVPPKRWFTFALFWEDMKDSYAEGLSIDRIDNDKGYSKDNCRWATREVQTRNTRLLRCTNTSGYRGVNRVVSGKFVARINHDGKLRHIGTFSTDVLAAEAYDNYVLDNNLEHTINNKRIYNG